MFIYKEGEWPVSSRIFATDDMSLTKVQIVKMKFDKYFHSGSIPFMS